MDKFEELNSAGSISLTKKSIGASCTLTGALPRLPLIYSAALF
jgi:hypothetical protein